ncbi:MAG: alpha/beta hydrolase [Cyanobacteria bacterium SZAS LIN-3]|nr:alpha/beta hydrolase [Cyanobacteria bacterium SZAS LIN-3]
MKFRAFLTSVVILSGLAPLAFPLLGLAQGQPGGQGLAGLSQEQKRVMLQKFLQKRGAGRGAGRMGGATPVDTARVNLKSDLAYGKDPLQKIDVYMPKDPQAGPMPILIFFHGGGWRRGDKAMGDHGAKGNNYTAKNIIFVSGNYRLAPAVVHPKQVEDVAAAVAYVKEHAAEFGGDPDRIYVMGHSAGAHLVDLLGTNERFLAEKGLSFKDIKGVISLDTASLNLSERKEDNSREIGLVGPMIDTAFGTDPKVLADASPTLQIHPGKKYPPFLMFCGENRQSCVAQHEKFEKAMKAAGGTVTVTPVPLNHGEINRAAGQADSQIFQAVEAMIKGDK